MAGIVFDAGAGANFTQHFKVVTGTLLKPLRLKKATSLVEKLQAILKLSFNIEQGLFHAVFFGDVMLGGVDVHLVRSFDDFTRDRIEADDVFDLIAEEADTDGFLFAVSWQHFERIASDAEDAWFDLQVIALVLHVHQLAQEGVAAINGTFFDVQDVRAVGIGVAQAVDG